MAAIARGSERTGLKEKTLEDELQFQKKLNNITNKIHSAKDTNEILLSLQDEILAVFNAQRLTIQGKNRR